MCSFICAVTKIQYTVLKTSKRVTATQINTHCSSAWFSSIKKYTSQLQVLDLKMKDWPRRPSLFMASEAAVTSVDPTRIG